MSKKSLFIGAVASIIAINQVFADTTVTSKQYVDTTRQATIPAAETNIETPGVSVVTYTDTAGQIGERWILEPTEDYADANELVTAGWVSEVADSVTNRIITTKKKCYQYIEKAPATDANCLLWRLEDQTVYGRCSDDDDCDCSNSPDTPYGFCNSGKCECQDYPPTK